MKPAVPVIRTRVMPVPATLGLAVEASLPSVSVAPRHVGPVLRAPVGAVRIGSASLRFERKLPVVTSPFWSFGSLSPMQRGGSRHTWGLSVLPMATAPPVTAGL